MEQGYIHLYTGDGKGKTTAAIGLAARALGQHLRVGVFFFLKSGYTGELASLAKLGATVVAPQGSGRFLWEMDAAERAAFAETQRQTLRRAMAMAPELDLLVLDEIVCAFAEDLVDRDELLAFLREKPAGLEVVLTGRGADEALFSLAHYATEMRLRKHPYTGGVAARPGIEF